MLDLAEITSYIINNVRKQAIIRWFQLNGSVELSIRDVSLTFRTKEPSLAEAIYYTQRGEVTMLTDFIDELSPTDHVLDVGANIGAYTCFAASVTENSPIAIEPYPANATTIATNLKLNGLSADIHELALADSSEMMNFSVPSESTPGYGIGNLHTNTEEGTIETQVQRGDDLLADGEQPTVVKIDVEGAEGMVIEGLLNTLSDETCRLVYCEIHRPVEYRPSVESYGTSEEDVKSQLTDLGFKITTIEEQNSDVQVKAIKPT